MVGIGVEARAGQHVPGSVGDARELQGVAWVARVCTESVMEDEQPGVVRPELLGEGAVEVHRGAHRRAPASHGPRSGSSKPGLRLPRQEVQRAADRSHRQCRPPHWRGEFLADVFVAVSRAGAVHGHGGPARRSLICDSPVADRDTVACATPVSASWQAHAVRRIRRQRDIRPPYSPTQRRPRPRYAATRAGDLHGFLFGFWAHPNLKFRATIMYRPH